jgi:predicted glycosyltransferase
LWNQGGPNEKDLSLLVNTINHSDLVVNMGSTMALDAAMLGKPSCYIKYDVPSEYDWTVNRIYQFIHFDIVKKTNPVFWIDDRNSLTQVLKEALNNSDKTLQAREQWIERVTHLPIEETNQRMWNYLITENEF